MSSIKEQYIEEGYVVVKDVLNPEQDIYPLQKAYSSLLDALAQIYLVEANSEALDRFDEMSLPERFAMSLGASRGTVLHHLDPVLNIFVPTFQWRKDLPDARIPRRTRRWNCPTSGQSGCHRSGAMILSQDCRNGSINISSVWSNRIGVIETLPSRIAA